MTPNEEPETGYSAFISYRSNSRAIAARLKRDLYAIAKRHAGHSTFKIFLDTSDLRPGPLSEEIRTAVSRSRCLVVLLDRTTVESTWVSQEIKQWRETVGDPRRLCLVNVDPEPGFDLSWKNGTFTAPDTIPAPLRDAFDVEQKWVAYTGRNARHGRDELAGLCARLMDIDASEYLNEESTYQRRRRRIITAVAVVMALLSAVATISAITALRNQQQAEANATQARAQADASEALLAATDSPTLAIERALRAARQSDSPTVRSAMLAVSQASRRLKRVFVFPEPETGHPVAAARFSADGTKLMAWGTGKLPGTTEIRAWDIATGATEATVTANATDIREVTKVGNDHLTACAGAGPVLIDLTTSTTTRLEETVPEAGAWVCQAHEFADGVILLSASPDGDGTAYLVDHAGKVVTITGVDSVATHPSARSAVVAGQVGVVLLSAGQRLPVWTTPAASTTFADFQDGFLVRLGLREWGFATLKNGAPDFRTVTVPAEAVDVAPVLRYGQVSGHLAWITADGTIGWTQDERQTKLDNSKGEAVWAPYNTRLEPLAYEDFVAVYRNTAAVVRPPGGDTPVDAPPDSVPANAKTDWSQVVVRDSLGSSGQDGTEPIVTSCAGRTAVVLHGNVGPMLVDGSAEGRRLGGSARFTDDCTVIDAGRSLSTVPRLGSREPVLLRQTLVADSVVVSPVGDQVALVKAGFPIEALSTVPADSLPRPWNVTTSEGGAVTALGEREVFVRLRELVIADLSGVVERTALPDIAQLAVAKPDGTGAVVAEAASKRHLLVEGHTVTPTASACFGKTVAYMPGPDFARLSTAAEAQIPVARTGDSTFVDCRDGREVPYDPSLEIMTYDIGRSAGRIVARSGGHVAITTWSRGDQSSLTTANGPPLPDDRGTVSFDPSGHLGLTYAATARTLTLYRRNGDTWARALNFTPALPQIVAAQVVDGGSLVLAVSAEGGFELFDAATGRLVASDPILLTFGPTGVTGFSARRVGDSLFVALQADRGPTSVTTIQIPVSISALQRQLCSLYLADECAT